MTYAVRLVRFALVALISAGLVLIPRSADAAASGTIKLTAPSVQPVLRGDQITLAVSFANASRRAVSVQRAKTTSSTWTTVAQGTLSSTGTFTARYTPSATYRYRALLPRTSSRPTRYSSTVTATVVTGWRSVSAGGQQTCGIWWDRSAWCWGSNAYAALGNTTELHTNDPVTSPVRVKDPIAGARWKSLSTGQTHTCGVLTTGSGWCWGDNGDGDLGIGTQTPDQVVPQKVTTASGSMWKRIDAGYSYTCGLRSDDTLWCWGFNDEGQVGYDSSGARVLSPHQVKLPAVQKQTWKSFSLGFYHACGLRWNSTLWCWGWNNGLQRADADQNLTPAPTMIPGPEGTWTGVTAGGSHTCAFLYNHQASCWGSNGYGQLGVSSVSGATADLLQIDSPFDGPAGTVVAGDEHSCGLTSDRFLWCWGRNQMGQLGIATNAGDPTTPQKSPAKVGTAKWLQLSAAEESTCGIQLNRTIWCWGNNVDGRLSGTVGTGSDGPNWAPRKVPSP